MSIISRLQLDHPALGTAGGAALHSAIEAIYNKLGDSMPARFFVQNALANAASQDFEHNFKCAFAQLRYALFLRDTGTGELTRIDSSSTPPIGDFAFLATPGFTTTKIRVTNNSGSARDIALLVFGDPVELDKLTDVNVPAPEDGQALVYDAATKTWVAGASGDASFKVQSVTDPNAVIKGGSMMLPDGRELATYDGAGSASTDFGVDLTINLDTILGSSPANATAYYLAIDLLSLGAPVTQTDTGRVVYPITQANFVLMTTTPESANRNRYVFRSVIKSATSGTVWSGSGSKFATLSFLKGEVQQVSASPMVYSVTQQTVGAVGSAGQIRQGHLLAGKSFPAAAQDTAKLSIFGMDNTHNDEYGTRNLTANGSPAATTGIFGLSNEAMALVAASSQYFSSSDAFFDPGNVNFCVGGWFYSANWKPSSTQTLFSQGDAASDRSFAVIINPTGLDIAASVDGASWILNNSFEHGITGAGWHHIALRYTATGNIMDAYVDGKLIQSMPVGGNLRNATTNKFQIGALNGALFFDGKVDELFFINNAALTDADIAKLAATRLDHNKVLPASRQLWMGRHYAAGTAPVSDFSGFVLDMSDTLSAFVDLSGCDPTDKVDLMLFDSGAAGAVNVPVQTPEFYFTANIPGAGVDTYLAEAPRSIQGFQLDANSHWLPLDLVGLVYIDETDGRKLKGDISSLSPSSSYPVRIVVSTTASAQAVGKQTASNLVGMIDGSRNGGGIYLKRPDGTIRELALDNSDNIVVLDT